MKSLVSVLCSPSKSFLSTDTYFIYNDVVVIIGTVGKFFLKTLSRCIIKRKDYRQKLNYDS